MRMAVAGVLIVALGGARGEKGVAAAPPALSGPITLEIGRTGESPARRHLEITPSGQWSERAGWSKEPTRRGKLRPAQLRAISAHLAAQRFDDLPAHIGLPAERLADAEARHFVRLSVGKKSVLLIGKDEDFSDVVPAGGEGKGGPPAEGEKPAAWSRLVALTLVIKDAAGSSPEASEDAPVRPASPSPGVPYPPPPPPPGTTESRDPD
jgi:hypothetical protein